MAILIRIITATTAQFHTAIFCHILDFRTMPDKF